MDKKTMDGAELMPCPFCGGMELKVNPVMGAVAVQCKRCGTDVIFQDSDLTRWNRRDRDETTRLKTK